MATMNIIVLPYGSRLYWMMNNSVAYITSRTMILTFENIQIYSVVWAINITKKRQVTL